MFFWVLELVRLLVVRVPISELKSYLAEKLAY